MGWSTVEGFALFDLDLLDHVAFLADQVEHAVLRRERLQVVEDAGWLLADVEVTRGG